MVGAVSNKLEDKMKQGNKKTENSEKIVCEIAMKLPSLNEYVNVCRTNPYKASKSYVLNSS